MHIVCIENITRGGHQGLSMIKQTLLHKLPLHELELAGVKFSLRLKYPLFKY